MSTTWVYRFDQIDEAQEFVGGDWDRVRGLLGGKGANLGEMTRLGIPVPPPHQTRGHIRQLMAEHRVSALPIVDSDGALVGIVTAADLLHDLPDGAPVSSFMTSPVLTVSRYEKLHIAARIMRNHRFHHLIVTEHHAAVGIVSAYDLLELLEDHRFVAKPGPTPQSNDTKRQ